MNNIDWKYSKRGKPKKRIIETLEKETLSKTKYQMKNIIFPESKAKNAFFLVSNIKTLLDEKKIEKTRLGKFLFYRLKRQNK